MGKRKSKKEKEEELIRRKDAIDALGEEPENWCDTDAELQAVFDWKAYVAAINAVPAADKKGEWIYNPEDYAYGNPTGSYECSRCGESVPDKTKFCPECGADMQGGEGNE